MEATLIPNVSGEFQGFLLEKEGFTVVCMPQDFGQFKVAIDGYILPYFEKKFEIKRKRLTLKYFGDGKAIEKVMKEADEVGDGTFSYTIIEKNGDYTLDLILNDAEYAGQITRFIVGKLKDNIYAERDTTLGETLFNLLKLRRLKIATAESFTGGRVISSVIANSGASECVKEGIVSYSKESKCERLYLDFKDLSREGEVSSMTAYRMASGLLKNGGCDLAVSTTGSAGPNPDGDAPVGTAFIGIGMLDGVHTYRLNLSGSREEITERAKNTALFLAIKKIKNL
jgi:nicotinamide-nucleotide amidase